LNVTNDPMNADNTRMLLDGNPTVAGALEHCLSREMGDLKADDRGRPRSVSPPAGPQVAQCKTIPRILLVATLRWPVAARLALAFRGFGCHVESVCPRGHPVDRLRSSARSHRYSATRPLESLLMAIKSAAPDLIVPCDDSASLYLHELYERLRAGDEAGAADAVVIERSLGSPSACALASARGDMADLVTREGLRVPDTKVVGSASELNEWMLRHEFPVVLKIDNTWGGLGVRIVHNGDEAQRAFHMLAEGPSLAKTLFRTVLDRDPSLLPMWLKHGPRTVTVQDFVRGVAANRAVACWRGQVLAGISVEALNTDSPTGPATVIRVIENAEMSDTAARVVKRLGLSGLWGFDFVLDTPARAAWLIEVNPRATPICHLSLGKDSDLPAALCSQLTGRHVELSGISIDATVIALFPGEWRRDPDSQLLHAAYHDVPWEEPGLVDEGLGAPWEERGLLARLRKRLWPRRTHKSGDDAVHAEGRNTSLPRPQR